MLMTCGASAGLAALSPNAPFAGRATTRLEELHKNFSTDVPLSAMSAFYYSRFYFPLCFRPKPVFDFSAAQMMPLQNYWMVSDSRQPFWGWWGPYIYFAWRNLQDLYSKLVRSSSGPPFHSFWREAHVCLYIPLVLGAAITSLSLSRKIWQSVPAVAILPEIPLFHDQLWIRLSWWHFPPAAGIGAISYSTFGEVLGLCGIENPLQNFVILGMAWPVCGNRPGPNITGIILISEMTGNFSHLVDPSLVS